MNSKKKNKINANVREFADADYRKKLSKDEQAWYDQFENEYYCNAHPAENSLHRTELGSDYDKKVVGKDSFGRDVNLKRQMWNNEYARRNDIQGNARASNRMSNVADLEPFLASQDEQLEPGPDLQLKFTSDASSVNIQLITELIEALNEPDADRFKLITKYGLDFVELTKNAKKLLKEERSRR